MLPLADYRTAIREFIRREAKPVDKYSHQPRLYELTKSVGEGHMYDDGVVFAAAWMHDLGVFVGHRPSDPGELARWDNVAYACEKTPALLSRFDFPAEKVSAVVEAIRTHQPAANPTTIEGIILRDADILEQIGAIGILRAVCKVGRDTRYSSFHDAVGVLERALKELPSQLRLETARQLSASRVDILAQFVEAARGESDGLLGG